MAAVTPDVIWSVYDPSEDGSRPRQCSTPGCKNSPASIRITTISNGKTRRHVFCEEHTPE